MHDPSEILSHRFVRIFERSDFDSFRQLAEASGNSHTTIANIAAGKFNAENGPGLFRVHRAVQAMDARLTDVVTSAGYPTVQQFLSRCPRRQDETVSIEAFGELLGFCDIYHEPIDKKTRIKRTGPKSMLVQKSRTADPEIIQSEYMSWSDTRKRRIYERQRQAWVSGRLTELDHFFEVSPLLGKRVQISFLFAACKVIDLDGEAVLAIFCEPLP